jgi:hypothetical protein
MTGCSSLEAVVKAYWAEPVSELFTDLQTSPHGWRKRKQTNG